MTSRGSGLDPILRRELIQTVIGAYQDADPGNRTVFVSNHLIDELEGLIDELAIIGGARLLMSIEADEARARYRKIRARFSAEPPGLDLPGVLHAGRRGRELELTVNGRHDEVIAMAALLVLLHTFAYSNFRQGALRPRRIGLQGAALFGLVATFAAASAAAA